MKFLHCSTLLSTLFLGFSLAEKDDIYYNKKEILSETGWKDVSIETNAPSHLSLLSQGRFDDALYGKYDKNYYYPASAGKDIEVFMFDNGFNFNLDEFSEVEANIEGFVEINGVKNVTVKAKELGIDEELLRKDFRDVNHTVPDHGTVTSTAVVGKTLGVAKKANIHGLVFLVDKETEEKKIKFLNQFIRDGINYVKENNLIKPHQTVFNFSVRQDVTLDDFYGDECRETQALINEISEMGVVFVAGAGNEFIEPYNEKEGYALIPCAYDNVICVGGVGNIDNSEFMNDVIDSSYYEVANYTQYLERYNETITNSSNYGNHVDIYAPFLYHYHGDLITTELTSIYLNYDESKYEIEKSNYGNVVKDLDTIAPGTSMSSPLVSGVVATLMSELYPERKFTTSSMLDYLKEIGEEGIVKGVPEGCPNYFINNGKKIIFDVDINTEVEDPFPSDNEVEISEEDVDISEESDSDSDSE